MEVKIRRKGTILIILHQEFSKYNAVFRFVRELISKGCRVIFVGDSRMEQYVTVQGFEYKAVEPDSVFIEGITMAQQEELKKHRKFGKSRYRIRLENDRERQIAEHGWEKIEKWLETEPVEVVLIDQGCMHYSVPFLKKGIPILGLDTNFATPFNLEIPPAFSTIIPGPGQNLITYVRNFSAWLKIYAVHFFENIYYCLYLCYGFGIFSYRKAFFVKKMIKKYGGKIQWWDYGRLRLKVPGIVICPIEFEYPFVSASGDRCYIGASVDPKRRDTPIKFNWGIVDESKPLIYCSVGSHPAYCKDRMRLFQAVIEALQQRPHLQAVIQVSELSERETLNPPPGNVIILEWVPQIEILSRSYIFITHGGMSSVREAIYTGVPMIVFPWGVDQPGGGGARVVFHHLGLRGDIKKVTPGIVGEYIDKICNDNTFHQSVKQMQKVFHQQENCKKGVDFIERFIPGAGKTFTPDLSSKKGEDRDIIEI
jgi:hypothetical protein